MRTGRRAGVCRSFHRADVAANHRGHVAGADVFLAHKDEGSWVTRLGRVRSMHGPSDRSLSVARIAAYYQSSDPGACVTRCMLGISDETGL